MEYYGYKREPYKTPPRYTEANLEKVPATIKAEAEKINETRKGLYIHGPVGTGKTFVAYAIARYWYDKNFMVRFYNTPDLLQSIKEDFDRHQADRTRADDELRQFKGLLILDDIGAENTTPWAAETLYLVINRRYELCLPTVLTSNLTVDQLAEKMGDRIASRIVEMCEVIQLNGKDRRIPH